MELVVTVAAVFTDMRAMQQQASMRAPIAQAAVAARCMFAVAGKGGVQPEISEAAAVQQKGG